MFKVELDSKEVAVKVIKFSGGEIQVKVDIPSRITRPNLDLTAHVRSADDLMTLLLLKDAIDRKCNPKTSRLVMPYLPYARQDRVCARGEALSVRVCTDLINALKFDTVEVWDCHSDVGVALLDNCVNVSQVQILHGSVIAECLERGTRSVLVSPDAGANKKTLELAKSVGGCEVIRADKSRNVQTGQITGTEVYGNVEGKTCVIVDDIADGGATFIYLARALKDLGAAKVILYVTHGIFSKGVDVVIEGGVDSIYTPNYWPTEEHKDVNIIKL